MDSMPQANFSNRKLITKFVHEHFKAHGIVCSIEALPNADNVIQFALSGEIKYEKYRAQWVLTFKFVFGVKHHKLIDFAYSQPEFVIEEPNIPVVDFGESAATRSVRNFFAQMQRAKIARKRYASLLEGAQYATLNHGVFIQNVLEDILEEGDSLNEQLQ